MADFRNVNQIEDVQYICDYLDHAQNGIVDLTNLTIGDGDAVKFDTKGYVNVEIFENVNIEAGGSLEMGANTTLCLVQDSTLTVKNGGKLWINGMGVYPSENTSIVVEEGAEFFMNDSYQSDTVNIIYKYSK